MPSYTSTARRDAYDYLRQLLRTKAISSTAFQHEKAKIDRREAKSVAYAAAKREAQQEAARVRREAKKEERAIPRNLLLNRYAANGVNPETVVRDLWKMTRGTTVRIVGGSVDMEMAVDYGDKGYREFRYYFVNGTNGDYQFDDSSVFLVLQPTPISKARLTQRFRDGINHCVFTPLISKLESRLLDGSADSTRKRILKRIKTVKALADIYGEGVPEDKMNEVAKASGVKIQLYDIFGEKLEVYNEHGREGCLQLTNTRENHVDVGMVVDNDAVELEQEEMVALWNAIKESGEFYMIDGNLQQGLPTRIRTLNGAWCLRDAVRTACRQFDKDLGIINYKINAVKQPELNEFLRAGRIINSAPAEISGGEATGCADMPRAYTQFKKCSYYRGFLGLIHQFRSGVFDRTHVEMHLGYYGVRVLGGVSELMGRVGIRAGMECVLFSPELLYFMDEGLEVDILRGAWGSRFDFEFPDYMLKDRAYCIWSGRLGMEHHTVRHTVKATREWASHIASYHDVFFWESQELLTIKTPAKNCFTAHHILGAITAYTRIQMMEALKLFNINNICRVVMDGIHYTGEKPAGLEWFKDKKPTKYEGHLVKWYYDIELTNAEPMGKIVGNTLLTGQGGSGKTYSVFMDKGFNNVLYVSPSHILGQDVRLKYGAKYTTYNKLLGIECQPYSAEQRMPPVIFLDEITQIDAEWIERAFEMYPKSLIILAGDVDSNGRWFQCRGGDGSNWTKVWTPYRVDVVEFTEDRRSRDDGLKELKLKIRKAMKECCLETGLFEMNEWAEKELEVSYFDFKEGDTCIAGTHRTNQKLLERGVVSGYYKKGGYVSTEEKEGYDKRGSFTIHSYQGKTIETGRVWIFIDDLFEYAMLYTAVSRAVSIDQIRFVKSRSL